jgi:hypothetical protein
MLKFCSGKRFRFLQRDSPKIATDRPVLFVDALSGKQFFIWFLHYELAVLTMKRPHSIILIVLPCLVLLACSTDYCMEIRGN